MAEPGEKPLNLRRSEHPSSADAELVTVRGKRIKVTDEEFAMMLEKAGGFKSRVAKQLGVTVSAVCHRIERSAYLREACKTIEETVLDLAEASLIKAAQNGEPWAVTFILKCKGRKRGWIERQDFAFESGEERPAPFVLGVIPIAGEEFPETRPSGEIIEAETVAEAEPSSAADAEPPECAPGRSVSRPPEPEAQTPAPRPEAAQTPGNARVAAEPPPRIPRTPSEAAAIRKAEEESRRRDEHGGGEKKFRAMPVTFPKR